MTVIKACDFLNTDMKAYSQYDNIRKIPKLTDGLKDSQRKAVFGLFKNGSNRIKVSQLAEQTSQITNYLHGGDSLAGAIALMAQDYPGSNNYPVFKKDGQFGNRISPDSAASRYIFVSQHQNLHTLFSKDDELILKYRFDEGEYREPETYYPIIPLWILNGSVGIGNGFSTKIGPRDVKSVVKYINAALDGTKQKDETINKLLSISFNNYTGDVEFAEPSKYFIYGSFERLSKTRTKITEVPVTFYLDDYKKILNKLIDNKIIKDYTVESTDNNLTFYIDHSKEFSDLRDEEIVAVLKLKVPFSENIVLFDVENRLTEYESVVEPLNKFIEWRTERFEEYRLAKIDDLSDKIHKANLRVVFIDHWNKTKDVHKLSKEEMVKSILTKYSSDISEEIDSFMALPISSLTEKKINDLKESVKTMETMKEEFETTTAVALFKERLKNV